MLSYSVMSNSLQTHEEPPSSVHGILQIRILEWVAISSLLIFLTQGSDLSLLHCRQILYQLSYKGSPHIYNI